MKSSRISGLYLLVAGMCWCLLTACTSSKQIELNQYYAQIELARKAQINNDRLAAEAGYKQALALATKYWGINNDKVAACLTNLGWFYNRHGDFAQADTYLQEALLIRRGIFKPDDIEISNTLLFLANNLADDKQYARAQKAYEEALEIREKALAPNDMDIARTLDTFAGFYWTQAKYKEAAPLLEKSLAIKENILGTDHKDLPKSINNLAAVYFHLGRYLDSEKLFKRSLFIQETLLGKESPDVSFTLDNYARVLEKLNRQREADALLSRAKAIRAKVINQSLKETINQFAQMVIMHLLDTNWTSYKTSQQALLNGELADSVVTDMQKQNVLAKDKQSIDRKAKELCDHKHTSEIKITRLTQQEPNHLGLIPIEITGRLSTTFDTTLNSRQEKEFKLRLLIGFDNKTKKPVVVFLTNLPITNHQAAKEHP